VRITAFVIRDLSIVSCCSHALPAHPGELHALQSIPPCGKVKLLLVRAENYHVSE